VIGKHLDIVASRCFRFTAIVLFGSEVLGSIHPGLNTGGRVAAIVSLMGMAWFLAEYKVERRSTSLWWALAVLLGIGISLSRTALLAGFVLFLVTFLLISGRRRARNVTFCILLLAAGYWAITSWAPLRDRFTQGDVSLSVGGISVNAEGRTQVWPALWSGIQKEPLIGHGPGSATALSLSISPAFDNPHNDYLRVLYDFGFIGLLLFGAFVFRTAGLLGRANRRSRGSVPPVAALNAGLAVLIVMATDNPLDYPSVTIPLGVLIGLGLGLGVAAQSKKPRLADRWQALK
jgi:O-antigen ligase